MINMGLYVCPVCGKRFYCYVPQEWTYRLNGEIYCSYTCWRKVTKNIEYHTHKKKGKLSDKEVKSRK